MKASRFSTWAARAAALSLLLLIPAPSARANPPPQLVERAAIEPAAPNALLQFTSHAHVLGFRTGEFYLSNGTYALRVEFLDANPIAPMSDTPSASDGHALPLSRVTYAKLWQGITLAYDAARGGIVSSSYRLEPGADPRAIHLRYNAPVTLNSDGTLTIAYETGEMVESAPLAWQEVQGARMPVAVQFVLRDSQLATRNDQVGFAVGEYDAALPLFIDPTLAWNTFLGSGGSLTWNSFLGGSGGDSGNAIAVDGSGNVYVAGASNAAWGSPVSAYTSGNDAFAAKLNSSGALTWNTFLGGSGYDDGLAIAVDGSGNVYVAGTSDATWGSPVSSFSGGFSDAFAAKLNSSGALTWNTFLGGSGSDIGYGIAVDGSGNVYVAGTSTAAWGSPVRAYTSGYDAFAAKLNSIGALAWNSFLGGSGDDIGNAIAVDGSGNVYVAGYSTATWQGGSPPVRAYTSGYDAFAAKLNSSGALAWNTFLGGSGNDSGRAIAVDGSGNVYVAGYSTATWQGGSPPVRAYTSGYDAFAAKLNSSGALTWNTFLGGASGNDYGFGIAVDGSGNVYVAGLSDATWGSPVRAYTTGYEAFAAKLNSSGALTWNTFLGGSGFDYGNAIAVDGSGNVYVAGSSNATWGSPVNAYTSFDDAFAAKLSGDDYGYGIAVDGSGNVYVAGTSTAAWGSPVRAYTSGLDAFAAKLDASGALAWNSFLGGSGSDIGYGIAVDGSGNVYVAGYSDAAWQGNNPPVRAYTSLGDAFAAKLNSGGALAWNSFLGGSGSDIGYGIAVDGSGNVYVAGYSGATWGSPVGAYTSGLDAFAAKLDSGGALAWNSFLGGSGSDIGLGIAVDGSGNVYVAGYSNATWGSPVRAYTSGYDAFAAKLNSIGALAWNSFLGGSGDDIGNAIAVDGSGNVYVAGYSTATWGSPVRAHYGGPDAFVAKINAFSLYLPIIIK